MPKGLRQENEAYFADLMKGFKIRKSILARCDSHDLEQGEDGVLKNILRGLTGADCYPSAAETAFLKM